MVLTNTKYKVIQKGLSTVEILIHRLIVLHIVNMFWIIVKTSERQQYLKKRVKNHHKKTLDFIFLDKYQSAQMMASVPLNMVRHMLNATN